MSGGCGNEPKIDHTVVEKKIVQNESKLEKIPKNIQFPPSIKYLVLNEFFTRFTFYGIRVVLALYVENALGLGPAIATVTVALLNGASYVTPMFGAFLDDLLKVNSFSRFSACIILSVKKNASDFYTCM